MTERQDWEEPVEWRIGRLEESQRRMRGWVIGLSVMLLLVFFYAARPGVVNQDVITAREFRIVDEEGESRGIFAANEFGTRLALWEGGGSGSLEMKIMWDGRPQFTLGDRDGGREIKIEEEENGDLSLRMLGAGEEASYLTLLLTEDEDALVQVGRWGEGRWAQMFAGVDGTRFYIGDTDESASTVYLGVPPDGYTLLQFAEGGRRTMQLKRWDTGHTGLLMFGLEDESRVSLIAEDKGSSSLRLAWDWERDIPQATINLTLSQSWGGPFLTLADNRGGKVAALHAGGEMGSFIGIHEEGLGWTVLLPQATEETQETPSEEADTTSATAREE